MRGAEAREDRHLGALKVVFLPAGTCWTLVSREVDSDVTRRHQRDKTPRWRRSEHATTGADQTPRRRAARCWPSAGLRGGQLAVSSQVPWIVCGRLPLRGHSGPGPVRASVLLSQVLVEKGVTPAVHLRGPAPLATPRHHL